MVSSRFFWLQECILAILEELARAQALKVKPLVDIMVLVEIVALIVGVS